MSSLLFSRLALTAATLAVLAGALACQGSKVDQEARLQETRDTKAAALDRFCAGDLERAPGNGQNP
jgi:hypothetical protein